MPLAEVASRVISGEAMRVKRLVSEALRSGTTPDLIVCDLSAGMEEVGRRFSEHEVSIPEVLASARAMHAALEILRPALARTKGKSRGLVAMATVEGDIHDIGKNLVSMMLEGAGFSIIDLGVGVPAQRIVECVRRQAPDIVGLSALLGATMQNMRDVIAALEREGLRGRVKVMVGGAPVSQSFADEIGADAYGADAYEAVQKARALLGISR